MAKNNYEVIVGNVGKVHNGSNFKKALESYREYVETSKLGRGRAGHEPVTLFANGEPSLEYDPNCPHLMTWREIETWIGTMGAEDKDRSAKFYLPTEDEGPLDVAYRYHAIELIEKPNKVDGPVAKLFETDNF